jgi:hypothetical protein
MTGVQHKVFQEPQQALGFEDDLGLDDSTFSPAQEGNKRLLKGE